MNVNRIFCAEQIVVPPELANILKEWTKDIIRNNPHDVLSFSEVWFNERASKGNNALSEEELEHMKKLFDQYDTDGNGKMETRELKNFITNDLGFDISDTDLEKVVRILDADGSGYLEFDEIIQWWSGQC